MLTWRLWRALRFPDEGHPLFERVREQPVEVPGQRYLRRLSPLGQVFASLLPALVVVVAPVALLLASNVLGGMIAFNVMQVIRRERDGHTYDLLALLPMGLGAVNWQIAAACTLRVDAVDRMAQFRTLAVVSLVLLMFYLSRYSLWVSASVLIAFMALNLDALQSLIIGCLSGMLAQSVGETTSPFAALGLFAFAQIILVYLPVTAAAIVLYNAARPVRYDGEGVYVIVALILLGMLFGLREVIIRVMWRMLEWRLL
jgi:hypothetical protein